jgi:hypothetical protein
LNRHTANPESAQNRITNIGAGHILNNDLRISGNLFWQVTSHQPGQQVAAAPGRSIINDANGLVFVKRTDLSPGVAGFQNPPDGDTAKG